MNYTLKEAAEITKLSISTLRRRVSNGEIPRYKYSSKILVPASYIIGEDAQTSSRNSQYEEGDKYYAQ